jgi:MFS family permease
LSMLGYGAVLPFEIIYLHDGRGFSLVVAGLVVGTVTGLAVAAAPFAGAVSDRVGARETAAGAMLLGLLLLANALTVVLAQIPVAKLAEGRRRAVTMAIGSLTFVVACLLVAGADLAGRDFAHAALIAAAIAFGVGECFHTTALSPLVADLAPPALRGRYMATIAVSFWLGLALAPTLGTQLLSVSPPAALLVPAAVALAASLSALALERELPAAMRLTPRPASTLR